MIRRSILVLALAAALAVLSSCAAPSPSTGTTPGATPTDVVASASSDRFQVGEVRNYKGINLDPAVGPADNSISGVQTVDLSTYRLVVDGLVDQPQSLAYAEVLALTPQERQITLHCVTGWDAVILWKGVRLAELIDKAGAKDGAVTVIFTCVDGYTTSLPLGTIRAKDLILAYQANGLDLPVGLGYPFIVVAEDKYGYKWARWVTTITLSNDRSYKGYWESAGYDNEADVGK